MSIEDVREEEERHLLKVQKLLSLAGGSDIPGEQNLAAQRAHEYIARHKLRLRYIVRAGTELRILPIDVFHRFEAGTPISRGVVARVVTPRALTYFDTHRSQKPAAMFSGFLQFEKHGYVIFAPIKEVQVFL